MSTANSLAVNYPQGKDILRLFPRLPLFSSHLFGWEGIYVQHHQQPVWEMPESFPPQHVVVVHHGEQPSEIHRVLDGRRQSAQVGDGYMGLIPAKASCKSSWSKKLHCTSLMLEPSQIHTIAHEFIYPDQVELIPHVAVHDPLVHQIGLALLSELKLDGLGTRLYAESMATALWVHLLKKYSTRPLQASPIRSAKRHLQPAIDYMQAHLNQDLKLAELAAVVNMSQFYFGRVFKQHMGITPYQYLIQQRVERSKQLLAFSHLSIAEIAYHVGFSKQSNFAAHFRKATGVTPTVYRNSL